MTGAATVPARRRRLPRMQREQQMLDAAGRVFAQRGYEGASMAEIAAAAGITKPMLYAYFGSKEGLYLAYIDRAGRELLARMRRAVEAAPSDRARTRAGIDAFFGFVDERRDGWSVLHQQLAAPHSRALSAHVARMRDAIVGAGLALLAERSNGADAGELELVVRAVVGAGESLAGWWLEHPERSRDELASALERLAEHGLLRRPR